MIRKSVNCLVTLSLMFFVFLFVYACSSDADYSAKIEDLIGIYNQLLLNNLQVISQKYGRNL